MRRRTANASISTSTALRILSAVLVLAIVSVAGAALFPTVAWINGSSAFTVEATLSPPLTIERGANRWEMGGARSSGTIGDPAAIGGLGGFSPDRVVGELVVHQDDEPGAIALYRTGLALIALAAVAALVLVHRVVDEAREEHPFDRTNVRRLRIAGVCALFIPLIGDQTESLLNDTIEVGDAVTIAVELVPWWPFLLAAAGALGLAEIFRHGSELQDFEQLAI